MPRFQKKVDELKTHFDKWLYFIKNLEVLDSIPIHLRESVFEQAFAVAEIACFNPQQLEDYENSLKYYRDLKNVIDTASSEAEERGLEKGIEIGVELGKEREKLQRIQLALQQGILTTQQIAILFDVDESLVLSLK